MRTKHILTALAIPALFAACVADDFNEAVTGSDMAQRALLSEDFKLNFGGPDTRFSAGEGSGLSFSYEVGDTIGGAIIDQYDPSKPEGQQFPVVPYVSTNHPFVLNAQGEWAINHTMVEGNYLFYFPYNENNHARTAPMYSIPVMQDLSGKDGKFDPKASVEKYNMGVGAQFLNKEDLNASLQLVNIFGYAKIKVVIDNHYAGGYVDKIVLQANGNNEFALNGQISNKTVSGLFAKLETSTKDYQDALKQMTETSDFALNKNDTDEELYINDELNKASKVMVAKVPEGTELKADGQNNKTFETYLVVPAQDFATVSGDSEVTLYIYTTEGNVYAGGIQNWNVTRNGIMSVTVSVSTPDEIPYVVTSEEDWNNYVSLLGKNQNSDKDGAAKFIIAGKDFAITNNTKYPTNGAEITVEGTLKVAGDNVTMKNVSADEVVIEEGAKLTTDGTFAAKSIENNGTLEFAVVYDEEKEDEIVNYKGVKAVDNEPGATLNILEDAKAEFVLKNNIDEKEAAIHGAVNNKGTLTLAEESVNKGIITNDGSLRGQFTNEAEIVYRDPAIKDEADQTNRYTPTIVNNGEIFITEGTATNKGDINNNKGAEISCSKTGVDAAFANEGTIDVADGSRLLISSNTGEIVLHKLDQTNWAVESGDNGTVAYETSSADYDAKGIDLSTKGKGITKLYVTDDFSIAKFGDVKDIEVTEGTEATLTLPNDAALKNELTVKKDADVAVVSTKAVVASLVVEKGATLTINETGNMTATAVKNAGTVYVGGTFTTDTMSADAVEGEGEFRNTSSESNNIVFGDNKVDATFETALKAVVAAWLDNATLANNAEITDWSKLNAEFLAKVAPNWKNTKLTEAKKAAEDAYNKWKGLEGANAKTLDQFVKDYAKVVKAGVDAEKAKGDKALSDYMAKLTPDTWLGETVYTQASATAKILNGETELSAGFETYIKTTYGNTVSNNNRLKLSTMSYKYATGDEPDDSYIRTYAGAEEYDVMKILVEFAEGDNNDWFKTTEAGNVAYTKDSFKTLAEVNEAMGVIYSYYNGTNVDPLKKYEIEQSGIITHFPNVYNKWKYTNDCIEALNNLFE